MTETIEKPAAIADAGAGGLSEAEAARRLAQYGENVLAESHASALRPARPLLLGADPVDDRGRGAALRRGQALGRPRHHPGDAHHQRRRRLLAGVQGRQRHPAPQAAPGAEGAGHARRRVEGCCRQPTRAGRPHRHLARRHHPGRRQAHRRRLSQRRPIGAHRRVAAGRQEGRRYRLFRLDRPAGGDDRCWSPPPA